MQFCANRSSSKVVRKHIFPFKQRNNLLFLTISHVTAYGMLYAYTKKFTNIHFYIYMKALSKEFCIVVQSQKLWEILTIGEFELVSNESYYFTINDSLCGKVIILILLLLFNFIYPRYYFSK